MFRRSRPQADAPPAGTAPTHAAPDLDPERELNLARAILKERSFRDVPDEEILSEAERLLGAWMAGETKMERPKLYDHYALVLLALLRQNRDLMARVQALETGTETATPGAAPLETAPGQARE